LSAEAASAPAENVRLARSRDIFFMLSLTWTG
jgi:hypothetical protein